MPGKIPVGKLDPLTQGGALPSEELHHKGQSPLIHSIWKMHLGFAIHKSSSSPPLALEGLEAIST